ncbi:hypothetical protein [Gemmatimonas aurantiaca]|uniref:hypothetical protein n=1 Tax=Gemmatimonas aurantiaca TaxID=173480 RepID=UPI00301D168B
MTQRTGAQSGGEAGVSVQGSREGGQLITVPDGKGGTTRIVIRDGAITVDGEQVTGNFEAPALPAIPAVPPFPSVAGSGSRRSDIPRGVIEIVAIGCWMVVAVVLGGPLVRSLARWFDKRTAGPQVPDDVAQRLAAIEQAVELVAVEVERISEGQRFTAKLLADRAAERVAERVTDRVTERSPGMERT